jgi:hypothetical protein
MDNFDLKKYLVENRRTKNSKLFESRELNGSTTSVQEMFKLAGIDLNSPVRVQVDRGSAGIDEWTELPQDLMTSLEGIRQEILNDPETDPGDLENGFAIDFDTDPKDLYLEDPKDIEEFKMVLSFFDEGDHVIYQGKKAD